MPMLYCPKQGDVLTLHGNKDLADTVTFASQLTPQKEDYPGLFVWTQCNLMGLLKQKKPGAKGQILMRHEKESTPHCYQRIQVVLQEARNSTSEEIGT